MSPRKRNPESGYALLMVFAMASVVAIGLYSELPRVAFEAQRDKEDLLMSRGHEYIRAITLYVHKFNRFPASMDELEDTNKIRFLRRRYADPMTGKADWRLLHAGPGGTITDSILNNKKDATATQQTFITELQMFGTTPVGQEDSVNLATRKRASDQPGGPGDPSISGGNNLSSMGGSNLNLSPGGLSPGGLSPAGPAPGNSGYNGPVMVLPDGSIVPANTTGTAPPPGAQPGGMPGAPGFSGGMPLQPSPVTSNGQNTPPLPGQFAPPNGAASLINQILTSPRPGGINGLPGTPGSATPTNSSSPSSSTGAAGTGTTGTTPAGQTAVGAGLAGVASKREQEGIKTYNQRKKYNEWEFIYDIAKDPTKTAQGIPGAAGAAGSSGAQGGSGSTSPSSTPAPAGTGLGPAGTSLPTNPMLPGNPSVPNNPMAPTPPSQ